MEFLRKQAQESPTPFKTVFVDMMLQALKIIQTPAAWHSRSTIYHHDIVFVNKIWTSFYERGLNLGLLDHLTNSQNPRHQNGKK